MAITPCATPCSSSVRRRSSTTARGGARARRRGARSPIVTSAAGPPAVAAPGTRSTRIVALRPSLRPSTATSSHGASGVSSARRRPARRQAPPPGHPVRPGDEHDARLTAHVRGPAAGTATSPPRLRARCRPVAPFLVLPGVIGVRGASLKARQRAAGTDTRDGRRRRRGHVQDPSTRSRPGPRARRRRERVEQEASLEYLETTPRCPEHVYLRAEPLAWRRLAEPRRAGARPPARRLRPRPGPGRRGRRRLPARRLMELRLVDVGAAADVTATTSPPGSPAAVRAVPADDAWSRSATASTTSATRLPPFFARRFAPGSPGGDNAARRRRSEDRRGHPRRLRARRTPRAPSDGSRRSSLLRLTYGARTITLQELAARSPPATRRAAHLRGRAARTSASARSHRLPDLRRRTPRRVVAAHLTARLDHPYRGVRRRTPGGLPRVHGKGGSDDDVGFARSRRC